MRRGLGWSERLKAPRMISHQGALFQMGTERIQDGSPSFRIKLRISIIQLVPVRRNWANQAKARKGGGKKTEPESGMSYGAHRTIRYICDHTDSSQPAVARGLVVIIFRAGTQGSW